MGHCKVIEDMLDEVRYNAKCEMALNMLTITNLSFGDIAEDFRYLYYDGNVF